MREPLPPVLRLLLASIVVGVAYATVSPHGQMPDSTVPAAAAPSDDAYPDTYGQFALDGCVAGCAAAWVGDGECDEACNVRECNFDRTASVCVDKQIVNGPVQMDGVGESCQVKVFLVARG